MFRHVCTPVTSVSVARTYRRENPDGVTIKWTRPRVSARKILLTLLPFNCFSTLRGHFPTKSQTCRDSLEKKTTMSSATTPSEASRRASEDRRNPRERLLKLTSVDGILLPAKSLICDRIPGALRYQARPGDIFLATYPKAGATWTQYILWTIFNLDKVDQTLPSFDDLVMNRIPFLEIVSYSVFPLFVFECRK